MSSLRASRRRTSPSCRSRFLVSPRLLLVLPYRLSLIVPSRPKEVHAALTAARSASRWSLRNSSTNDVLPCPVPVAVAMSDSLGCPRIAGTAVI